MKIQTLVYYAGALKEKPSTLNKWFRQISNDIFDLNENPPELYAKQDEILCSFNTIVRMTVAGSGSISE